MWPPLLFMCLVLLYTKICSSPVCGAEQIRQSEVCFCPRVSFTRVWSAFQAISPMLFNALCFLHIEDHKSVHLLLSCNQNWTQCWSFQIWSTLRKLKLVQSKQTCYFPLNASFYVLLISHWLILCVVFILSIHLLVVLLFTIYTKFYMFNNYFVLLFQYFLYDRFHLNFNHLQYSFSFFSPVSYNAKKDYVNLSSICSVM